MPSTVRSAVLRLRAKLAKPAMSHASSQHVADGRTPPRTLPTQMTITLGEKTVFTGDVTALLPVSRNHSAAWAVMNITNVMSRVLTVLREEDSPTGAPPAILLIRIRQSSSADVTWTLIQATNSRHAPVLALIEKSSLAQCQSHVVVKDTSQIHERRRRYVDNVLGSGDSPNSRCRVTRGARDGSLVLYRNELEIHVDLGNDSIVYMLDENLVVHVCKGDSQCTKRPPSPLMPIHTGSKQFFAIVHNLQEADEERMSLLLRHPPKCTATKFRDQPSRLLREKANPTTETVLPLRNIHAVNCTCTMT